MIERTNETAHSRAYGCKCIGSFVYMRVRVHLCVCLCVFDIGWLCFDGVVLYMSNIEQYMTYMPQLADCRNVSEMERNMMDSLLCACILLCLCNSEMPPTENIYGALSAQRNPTHLFVVVVVVAVVVVVVVVVTHIHMPCDMLLHYFYIKYKNYFVYKMTF